MALIFGLVVVDILGHSIGLLAAGGDYLADSGAIMLALLAIWLWDRPPTTRRPEGHRRAPAYAALLNVALLLTVVTLVFVAAPRRLLSGVGEVHAVPLLVAAAAAVMVGGALVMRGDVDQDDDTDFDRVNVRAVFLDTVADAAAAAGAAVAGLIIVATGGWFWLDPVVALLISSAIGYRAVLLLRDISKALQLARVP